MFDIVDLCSLMPSVSSAMQSVMIAVNLPKPVPASDTACWDTSVAHWTQPVQQSNNAIILCQIFCFIVDFQYLILNIIFFFILIPPSDVSFDICLVDFLQNCLFSL